MKRTTKYKLIYGLALALVSCKSPQLFRSSHSDYSNCVSIYSGNPRFKSNLSQRRYFDSVGNLRESISYGGDVRVTKYYYDSNQVLIEKYQCLRSCDNGFRTIPKYDSLGRLFSYCRTYEASINIDTCAVDQQFFFDDQDRLIKERTINYKGITRWKFYSYEKNQVSREVELKGLDTISTSEFYYSDGLLDSINVEQKKDQFTKHYFYDSSNNLIERKAVSNNKPHGRRIYSGYDQKILYSYDIANRLIRKQVFSVDEKSSYTRYYQYFKNIGGLNEP